MKIGVLFEGSPKKPGGFYQSLQSATILKEINDNKMMLEFICLDNETSSLLKKKNFNVRLFSNSFYKKVFNFFMNFQFFNNLILNYKLRHPFTKFLNISKSKRAVISLWKNKFYYEYLGSRS